MRDPSLHGEGKIMANTIEGRNPVLEALKAGRPIGKILIAKNIEKKAALPGR